MSDNNSSYPTLNKIKDIFHKNSLITIYEDSGGQVVLGGFGWLERYDWEEIQSSPTTTKEEDD